jgi:hypothetical protein
MPSEERESLQFTKAGEQALSKETLRWRRMAGLVDPLLVEDLPS